MENKNQKRVLCITANMNIGGAETFLMKIYQNIDKSKYQMDFCVSVEKNVYAKEILSMGGKIFQIPMKSKKPIQSFVKIHQIVKQNNYKYVMRVNEHSLSVIDLIAAKTGGAEKLIMRSSNSYSGNRLKLFLHRLFVFLPRKIPDVKLAPSTLAAEYTFGTQCIHNGEVLILKNGLNIKKYAFSNDARNDIRKEFDIKSEFVLGHVGRFNTQKNHMFILDVFFYVLQKIPNAKLLLVGDGILIKEVKEKAEKMGIIRNCIFTGIRKDVNRILSALDVFIFPSFYEGMPNTVIEAQTAGLHCVISDTITKEADISGLVKYVSLNKGAYKWADEILNFNCINRSEVANKIKENGYEIEDVVKQFEKIVFD